MAQPLRELPTNTEGIPRLFQNTQPQTLQSIGIQVGGILMDVFRQHVQQDRLIRYGAGNGTGSIPGFVQNDESILRKQTEGGA